jgi:hypothetical protein
MVPLLACLADRRRIRSDSVVVTEMPWFGRHIDLSTLTSSGRSAAYELKVANTRRAVEQATWNRLAFERSYVVTTTMPRACMESLVVASGLGLIVLDGDRVKVWLESPVSQVEAAVRHRVAARMRKYGGVERERVQ